MANALASLFDKFVLRGLLARENGLGELSPRALSKLIWAISTVEDSSRAWHAIYQHLLVERDLTNFPAASLGNVMHTLAKRKSDATALLVMNKFAQAVALAPDLDEYNVKSLAQVLWSLASTTVQALAEKEESEALCSKLARALLDQSSTWMDTVAVSNALWALAKLHPNPQRAVDGPPYVALCDAVYKNTRLLQNSSEQSIANLTWAFAVFGYKREGLVRISQQVVAQCSDKGKSYSSQSLATICWGFAKLGLADLRLFHAILRECNARKFAGFTPRAHSTIIAACGMLNLYPAAPGREQHDVAGAMCDAVLKDLNSFSHRELCSTAFALASLGVKHDALILAIAHQVLRDMSGFSHEQLINLLWAFACWDVLHLPDVVALCKLRYEPPAPISKELATQLAYVRLAHEQVHGNSCALIESLHSTTQQEGEADVQLASHTQTRITNFLIEHFASKGACLNLAPQSVHAEASVAKGVLSVDILLLPARIAIEVDGPSHFCLGTSQQPTGKTEFKRRLLQRAGYRVLALPASLFLRNEDWGELVNQHITATYSFYSPSPP